MPPAEPCVRPGFLAFADVLQKYGGLDAGALGKGDPREGLAGLLLFVEIPDAFPVIGVLEDGFHDNKCIFSKIILQ